MVDIEPYQYQKTTNVKEHNDIVAKINEIVDVLNNSGADTLGPRIDKLETDVSAIDSAVKIQYQDIASIKDKDQAQDNNIGTLDAQVKGITESLVSGVNVIDGTTTGKFKVRLDREKAPSINSNDYDLQKATSIELIQGSGPSMLKAQITLSDGTTLISDDFLFTTEAIGTDVYISSFVFKNGNVDGTISADIGLSNGSTLEANNFVVPMDPSLLNTVQDLSTRLTAVEGGSVAGFKELEVQVNTNKNNIATLTTNIDDLDIQKADQSNSNQEIVAGTVTATNITKGGVNVATVNDIPDISGKVNISQGISNAGKVLGINASGNVEPTEVSSGGYDIIEFTTMSELMNFNFDYGDYFTTYEINGGASGIYFSLVSGRVCKISDSTTEGKKNTTFSCSGYRYNNGNYQLMIQVLINNNTGQIETASGYGSSIFSTDTKNFTVQNGRIYKLKK